MKEKISLLVLWIMCGSWWVWHEVSQDDRIQELQVLLKRATDGVSNMAFCLEQGKFHSQVEDKCIPLVIDTANSHKPKGWTIQSAVAGKPEAQPGTVTHTTVEPHLGRSIRPEVRCVPKSEVPPEKRKVAVIVGGQWFCYVEKDAKP